MGLEKPITLATRDLIDADALRHALTALARETGDPGLLRKSGLTLIKQAFNEGRDKVRHKVEKEGLSGIAAARALSELQDGNDSMAGTGPSIGDIVYKNEQDTYEVGRRLKCKESFFLNYPNHNMDAWPIVEIRARLIFLFRVLKVDTVIVYDPSSLYERNPDHTITAKAVEGAFWMASSRWDYPEHFKAGLTPHGPKDAYYFARGPQIVNRVVDISDYIDGKVHANLANVTQGPAGNNGAMLKARLAAQGKKLPILGNDDASANRNYTKYFALSRDRVRGKQHGVRYAEVYHYVSKDENPVDEYISQNAVPL